MPAETWTQRPQSQRHRTVAAVLLALILSGRAAAQPLGHDRPVGLRATTAAAVVVHESPLPPNLLVPDILKPMVVTMWRQSRTFRRQCARLAAQPDLVIEIAVAVGVQNDSAATRITRDERGLRAAAQVEWRQPARYVEHIAHELEHVLEQVDGTDLPRMARQGVDGVTPLGAREYETARAQAAGRAVAREVSRR